MFKDSKSIERFEARWFGEIIDRVLIQVYCYTGKPEQLPTPVSLEQKYLDSDFRIKEFDFHLKHTYFEGDAFAQFTTSIGPGTLSTYLGSRPVFAENTVWYEPCIQDIRNAEGLRFNPENVYWKSTLNLCRKAVEYFNEKLSVGFPDLIENLDTIASLAGPDKLLFAFRDCPEAIIKLQDAIVDLYFEYYDRLYEILRDQNGCTSFSHFPAYGKGKVAKLQCDFSAMISPSDFEKFCAPWLEKQAKKLDRVLYHWDGPCALQHEKCLLNIKGIHAIQWVPGAGNPDCGNEIWYPLYERILKSGKSLMVSVKPQDAKKLVETFGPEKLNIITSTNTIEEAQQLVKDSYKWKKRV